jgi:phosphoglycolate phosphatase
MRRTEAHSTSKDCPRRLFPEKVGTVGIDLQSVELIVYDCDGVLIDSRRANKAFYNHILGHFGLPPLKPSQLNLVQTAAAPEVIEALFLDTDLIDKAQRYQASLSNDAFTPLIRPEPGARKALLSLRKAYRIALVTNRGKSLPGVLAAFRLEILFDRVVSALDVKQPKPNPEGLLIVLDHFSASPRNALYVGDSEADSVMCQRAGVPFVAYKNEALDAAYHVRSHRELLKLLLSGE